jgi:hypothetical protein
MTAPVDRSLWLDRFLAGGMVSSLQQLNGLPQQEFEDLCQVVDFQSPDIMDFPITEAGAGTEQPVVLPEQTIDERIASLKPVAGAANLGDAIDEGRRLGRTFLEGYCEDTKPLIVSSKISALK